LFAITIGGMFLIKDYIAARAQLVTFILLELTILLIDNFLEKKKVGVQYIRIPNIHANTIVDIKIPKNPPKLYIK